MLREIQKKQSIITKVLHRPSISPEILSGTITSGDGTVCIHIDGEVFT